MEHSLFEIIKDWASVVRDVGVIIGLPAIVAISLKLYDVQIKGLEAQTKANEAQIKVLEAQNSALKDTQYDRALSLIRSQKEIFEMERKGLEQKITDLSQTRADENELILLKQRVAAIDKVIAIFDQSVQKSAISSRQAWFQDLVVFSESRFDNDVEFTGASFASEVDFQNCYFQGPAIFTKSTFLVPPLFDNAKMHGANFRGADLTGADLSGVIFDKTTKFPSNLPR